MKLGLLVEAEEGLDWDHWRLVLSAAERLGFDSVWISDHLQSPWSADRHGLDAWIALAVAATQTRRVRLGSLVSPITLRPPAVLARMARAVDALAPGRLVLGLGLGWNAAEHHAHGIAFPPLAKRAHLLDKSIRLFRDEVPAPLLIGGGGDCSLDLAARHGDEWNMTTSAIDTFSQRSAALDQRCKELGRDPRAIRRSIATGFLIGRDEAELHERARRMQVLVPPLRGVGEAGVPAAARKIGWLAGTPGELVAALEPFRTAGVDLAILGHYNLDDVAALELVAARVMPALA